MAKSSRRKAPVKTPVSVSERALIVWGLVFVVVVIAGLARSWTINGGIHVSL